MIAEYFALYFEWFDALPLKYRIPLGLAKIGLIGAFMFFMSDTVPGDLHD